MVHVSALFFMDLKGKILISRNYRGDVDKKQAEKCVVPPAGVVERAAQPLPPCVERRSGGAAEA